MEIISALRKPAPVKATWPREPEISSNFQFLHEMATRIFSPVPLTRTLEGIVEFVSGAIPCDSCFIYVLEENTLLLRASKNPHSDVVNRLKLKLGQGITGWVAAHKKPVCIAQQAYRDPRFIFFNQLPEDRFEAFLSVPILSHGRVVGVINLQNRTIHHYEEAEIQIVSMIGLLVGAAVEIALLETKASQLADQLQTRKLVGRAKGILQRDLGIIEEEAYAALQRESSRKRKTLRDLAESIVFNDDFKRSLRADYRQDG